MADRTLRVVIAGDSRSLERSFASASRSARGFSVGLGTLAKSAAVIGGATAAVGGVAAAVRAGASEFSDASKAAAQTAAALKSTGGIANVTAKRVDALAASIMNYSGIDDEAVKSGENLLLTFKNVRNEIGKGNAVFDRATKAAVDLSVAGFGSIETTAKQLGKSLNDPVRGMTALGRAGVTFSDAQKKTIKALVETGQTLQAQKLILREVESQVGGSARAFGQTLPGQLSRLRESFRNTLGDLVGQVAPALSGALGQFNDFLGELGQARTVKAKLRIVLDRLEGLAKALGGRIGDAVAAVDWDQIWKRARGVADGLQRRLEQVDFSVVGKRIGDAFSDAAKVALPAAKDMADRISRAIDAIDWEKVGRSMGPGLASALTVAFTTLLDPGFWARNWDLALAVAIAVFPGKIAAVGAKMGAYFVRAIALISPRLAASMAGLAIRAIEVFGEALAKIGPVVGRKLAPLGRIVARVFGRLGRLAVVAVKVLGIQAALNAVAGFGRSVAGVFARLGRAIGGALADAWHRIERDALQAALRVVEPFTHVPGFIGAPFRKAKEAMQREFAQMVASAQQTATGVQSAIDKIEGRRVVIDVVVNTPGGPRRPEEGAGSARAASGQAGKTVAAAVSGVVGVFNAAVARANAAVKAASDAAANAAKARAAATRKAAAAAKKAAERQRAAFDSLIGSLGLQVDRAAATRGFADDLKVNSDLQAAIKKQIAVEGNTTELASQLFQAQQARSEILARQAQTAADARAKAAQRIQAAQFRALGLTGQGEQRTPGVANLRRQLEQLTARLGPDVAPKIKAQLAGIRKVLTDPVHAATEETRKAIVGMFQTIRDTFDQQAKGPLTKGSSFNLSKALEGLNVPPDLLATLRARLSPYSIGGLGRIPIGPQPVMAAAGGQPIVVNTTVELDGKKVGQSTKRFLQNDRRHNPVSRR